jgi:NUMOD4 motif
MEETWKPISGYEGIYEISSLGRVKSLARNVDKKDRGHLTLKEKFLQPSMSRDKPQVILSKDNKRQSHKVHLLVLHAFHGKCPKGEQAIFKNGRKEIREDNLMWGRPDPNDRLLTAMSKLMAKVQSKGTLNQPETI